MQRISFLHCMSMFYAFFFMVIIYNARWRYIKSTICLKSVYHISPTESIAILLIIISAVVVMMVDPLTTIRNICTCDFVSRYYPIITNKTNVYGGICVCVVCNREDTGRIRHFWHFVNTDTIRINAHRCKTSVLKGPMRNVE